MEEDKLTANDKPRYWLFHPSRPYFFYDPEGDGFSYYATENERDKSVKSSIENYLDDAWDESVTDIIIGKITHEVEQIDKEKRPEKLSEDGVAEDGSYWENNCKYKCNYGIKSINQDA